MTHANGELKPAVIAHRGASAVAPENTVAAFEAAIATGCDGIELDVRHTSEGRLVILHDKTLDRTTNGSGLVAEMPYQDLRKLDAGSWFAPQFANERVPLLCDILQVYPQRVPLVIELKAPGIAGKVVEEIYNHFLQEGPITFTSFRLEELVNLKRMWRGATCGYLTRTLDPELIDSLRGHGIQQICPEAGALTPEGVAVWHDAGFTVRAWNVSNDELVQRCVECRVDGFTADDPAHALRLVGRGA